MGRNSLNQIKNILKFYDLKVLKLQDCQLSDSFASQIVYAMQTLSTVEELDLANNQLGEMCGQ